jgi:molybdopterin guanine dinucleotide-containing S/N-oxide reductase-like protein
MEVKLATKKNGSNEKIVFKGTSLSSFGDNSTVACVDVKNDKIIRIRPLHFDWKYKPEEFNPWKFEARGKTFVPPLKSMVPPLGTAYKKRVYSPNRILYPLKRIDWDSNGARNPQNRGKSKYVRISWDEALDIVVSEIKRVQKKYGPHGICLQAEGHGEGKVINAAHGCSTYLMKLLGGYTQQVRNPDSWEGWYWGAKHVWGNEPVGLNMEFCSNLYNDVAQNTEMLICQGCDQETTPWGFGGGHLPSLMSYWYTELGIKQIYISPDVNYAAAVHADKWIPILPNTDVALQLAIAYIWLVEGTYDKEYLKTHAVGFDKFADYVLGKEDGTAKTPTWASAKCGIPSRIIKALAREWAKKRTTVCHGYGGPYIRGPYSSEPARMEICLLGMQGLGKPGVNQLTFVEGSMIGAYEKKRHGKGALMGMLTPASIIRPMVNKAYRGYFPQQPKQEQVIPKPLLHDAILDGHYDIYGSSDQMDPVDDQFKHYVYPVKGKSEVHMLWTDTPCFTTCWNDANSFHDAMRSEKIEFILVQHPWMENDSIFADIILPSNTKFEEDDIGADHWPVQYNCVYLEEKAIEPRGETMSDWEIVGEIAKRFGLYKEYTEGKTLQEWQKVGFDGSGMEAAGLCTWKQINEKKYYVVPTNPDWEKIPAGMIEFYQDPAKCPMTTPSGKLEYYSQRLADAFPDDIERPPVPHWVEKSEFHDERISSERARAYSLLVMSNHPRWRVHAQMDDCNWFHEIVTGKVKGQDGYLYEPLWIHPTDAAKRGIRSGDIVNCYNERGQVLFGAYVTERIMPGVISIDHGSRYDPIVPGKIDRGGAINTICPHHTTSKNCAGMVTSGFLAEVKKENLEELRRQYPEAFARTYDYASGLKFERVLAKEDK